MDVQRMEMVIMFLNLRLHCLYLSLCPIIPHLWKTLPLNWLHIHLLNLKVTIHKNKHFWYISDIQKLWGPIGSYYRVWEIKINTHGNLSVVFIVIHVAVVSQLINVSFCNIPNVTYHLFLIPIFFLYHSLLIISNPVMHSIVCVTLHRCGSC